MKSALIILLLGFIYGCGGTENQSYKASIPELDSTDYEIISAAIQEIIKPYQNKPIPDYYTDDVRNSAGNPLPEAVIILDSTDIEYISNWSYDKHHKKDSTDTYMTDRLTFENRKRYSIDKNRITGIKTYILDQITRKYGFEKLYSKYPDAWSVVGFSKPSYSLNSDKAVLFIFFQKAGKWGEGHYFWFKKEGNQWINYDKIMLWIS